MSEKESSHGIAVPIPGVAGASIHAALQVIHLHPGEAEITITKRRVESGGYIYVVSNLKKD